MDRIREIYRAEGQEEGELVERRKGEFKLLFENLQ